MGDPLAEEGAKKGLQVPQVAQGSQTEKEELSRTNGRRRGEDIAYYVMVDEVEPV